jgi:rhomboid family GlyGly-CTERM serine protease
MKGASLMSRVAVFSHGGFRPPWFSLIVTAIATGLYLLFGPAPEALVFDREAIQQGEWWRLVTGHLVHSDPYHAWWDIPAFALLAVMLEQIDRRGTMVVTLLAILTINMWLWLGIPNLLRYAGLSGIINGLFSLLLYRLWQRRPHIVIAMIAILYMTKLEVEAFSGQALLTNTLWPSVPSVHLAGVAAAVILIIIEKLRKPRTHTPGLISTLYEFESPERHRSISK